MYDHFVKGTYVILFVVKGLCGVVYDMYVFFVFSHDFSKGYST